MKRQTHGRTNRQRDRIKLEERWSSRQNGSVVQATKVGRGCTGTPVKVRREVHLDSNPLLIPEKLKSNEALDLIMVLLPHLPDHMSFPKPADRV